MTPNLAIFVSGLATLTLAIVFAVMACLYYRLLNQYFSLKSSKDFAKLKESELEEARKKSLQVYQEASKKAQLIMEEAGRKAGQIIKEAGVVSSDTNKVMTESLQRLHAQQLAKTEEAINQFSEELQGLLSSISGDVKQASEAQLEVFQKTLGQELENFSQLTIVAVETERKKTEAEMAKYKEVKIKEVEGKIVDIIQAVAKEVLGKSISLSEKEDLVIKALEEAKKENVF